MGPEMLLKLACLYLKLKFVCSESPDVSVLLAAAPPQARRRTPTPTSWAQPNPITAPSRTKSLGKGGEKMIAVSERHLRPNSFANQPASTHFLSPQRDGHHLPGHVHETNGPLGHFPVGLGGETSHLVHGLAHSDHVCGERRTKRRNIIRCHKTIHLKDFTSNRERWIYYLHKLLLVLEDTSGNVNRVRNKRLRAEQQACSLRGTQKRPGCRGHDQGKQTITWTWLSFLMEFTDTDVLFSLKTYQLSKNEVILHDDRYTFLTPSRPVSTKSRKKIPNSDAPLMQAPLWLWG